jgi:carbonic anhydrase/SulP family sulfate permease
MALSKYLTAENLPKDIVASVVVFLVALPLCLGIALASSAPLFSGVIAGIVGGIVVGSISRSQTSVSGPSAGSTAIVIAQIAILGSFEAFMVALIFAGIIQILMGIYKIGFISDFVPTNVIKGLLAAIGIILVLKQIPHILGHDTDPEGDMSFFQFDHENTFSEIVNILKDFHPGAAFIGILSLILMVMWDRVKILRKSPVPASIVVVVIGVLFQFMFAGMSKDWAISGNHLVSLPVTSSMQEFFKLFNPPAFEHLLNIKVYVGALVIAAVASLETLLNLEAVDKIDPKQRTSPPNRELIAQGVGNMTCGLLGGLPIASVIVRSSVNINNGAATKLSAILHGVLLLICVSVFPTVLNHIPMSCLAAVLMITGFKLTTPALFVGMWNKGLYQFLPFFFTVIAIVFTDLLIGILIGISISVMFILYTNLKKPIRLVYEKHVSGDVMRIELANIVSFLNRASFAQILSEIPAGSHVLIDAHHTDYIDPDVMNLLVDFKQETAPVKNIQISMVGFEEKYTMVRDVMNIDYSSREVQDKLTPAEVIDILKAGNQRFRDGHRLVRDFSREMTATATGQFPIAVVLSCIDSRTPTEIIFDLGVGDIFSVRIAGHVTRDKVLGSMEYACAVSGAKLALVMGHTRCGAVTSAVDLHFSHKSPKDVTGCDHLDVIIDEIQLSIPPNAHAPDKEHKQEFVNDIAARNVIRTVDYIRQNSDTLRCMEEEGKIAIVGSIYDIASGELKFVTPVPTKQPVLT